MNVKNLFFSGLLCFLFSFNSAKAQDILSQLKSDKDQNVIYSGQALGGAFLHSNGWGLFFEKAKILSIYRLWFWEIQTANMESPQQIKIQNSAFPDAKGYFFGKLNSVQVFRFGTGLNKRLFRKNNLRCVEVDAVYSAGASIAAAKPVWLEIIPANSELSPISAPYNPVQDNPSNIYGGASFFDGLGQMKFYPGGYAKFGLNFDYANKYNTLKEIETGIIIDAYPQVIPIMAYVRNNQVFVNLYLSIGFGKRWY